MKRAHFLLAVLAFLAANALLLMQPRDVEARRGVWTCASTPPNIHFCEDYMVNNCNSDPDCNDI
jgi:hypothetical protein